jgi:hypothetical protein
MASGAGNRLQAEWNGVTLYSQPGLRSGRQAKDALYWETLQTTGKTTRILNRPKRVCVDHQSVNSVTRTGPRRERAHYPTSRGPLILAFLRHGGIYQSDVGYFFYKLGPGCRLHDQEPKLAGNPVRGQDYPSAWAPQPSGPDQAAGREGAHAQPPIVSMSSGRLFLDRVARQHCPSPLHRHAQNTMHSSDAGAKGDISTLQGRGHFYFALTPREPCWRPSAMSDRMAPVCLGRC